MSPLDSTYKGYHIRHNDLNGLWWIEKDGAFVCYATSREHAQAIIDTYLT